MSPGPGAASALPRHAAGWAALFVLLTVAAIASRPLLPIDETRYLGVAWEMWLRGDFLVPFRNGNPYSHKPPLLFWLIHAGWAVGGVNEIWPRLVSPLVGFATLLVTARVAQVLWPETPGVAPRAGWILLGSLLFALFSEAVMFDVLLALCVAIGALGLAIAPRAPARGFGLLALGIGLGVLAKGPVVLLHLIPAALLAPWWIDRDAVRWPRWYGGVALAFLGGAAIALAWAIPAGLHGGEAYRNAIFWGQSANRMVRSFAHQQPAWWYLPWLPVILSPWLLWLPLWRGTRASAPLADRGTRFALALMLPALLAFSLVSGKQLHYLLPQFPAFALFAARMLERPQPAARPWLAVVALVALGLAVLVLPHLPLRPAVAVLAAIPPAGSAVFLAIAAALAWQARTADRQVAPLAAASVLTLAAIHLLFLRPFAPAWDVHPIALRIAELQAQGRPVGNDGVYHGQFHFAGRLAQPLVALPNHGEAERWAAAHPDGALVLYFRPDEDLSAFRPLLQQPYRGRIAALFAVPDALPALADASAEEAVDEEDKAAESSRPRPPQ